jgi:S1-C subfamily serine protease
MMQIQTGGVGKICSGVVCCCLAVLMPLAVHAADLVDTITRIKPGIVAVGSVEKIRKPSVMITGSGFVVGDGNQVITNAHVVEGAVEMESNAQIAVFSSTDGDPDMRIAEVVARDVVHDVAILRIQGAPLPALTLGNAATVREGEQFAFTGFPLGMMLGLFPVTHRAIISAITPIAVPANTGNQLSAAQIRQLRNSFKVFQLDATAYPGNSGSPLYDPANGQVVGVINKVFVQEGKEHVLDRPSGISYAVPIEYAKSLLRTMRQK